MKSVALVLSFCVFVAVTGCATSSYSVGRDFSVANVGNIVKGKTTHAELVQWFGEPFSKTVVSETEEKWLYTHHAGTASAQSYVFTTKVQTTGNQKTLDVLLKNGVVTNFTFTEGPGPVGYVQ